MSNCTDFGLVWLRLVINIFLKLTVINILCGSLISLSLSLSFAVVQAQNITLQIGKQNNVYICDQDPASDCDHRHAERVNDVLVTDANGVQSAIGQSFT